jgi:hypothetical protein
MVLRRKRSSLETDRGLSRCSAGSFTHGFGDLIGGMRLG